ncbi:MAG: ribulose-phosphate 3-epimerase [Bacilli bacterium]|jgi:ribulose-phosphate 3-epimerase|nr:ribulose-phosphate 3-epimerase [Bacilli bacterium]
MQLSVSFLGMKENRKENILKLSNEKIDFLHIDVMDGQFVENKTDSLEELKKILPLSIPFDVHLMVEDTFRYIEEFATLRPHYMTIHAEVDGLLKGIDLIKSKNIKVGISICPDTPVSKIMPYLPLIDLVLVMTVNPGKSGQKLIPSTVNKVNELKRIRDIQKYHYQIEVDGGIDDATIKICKNADIFVVGSYITERMSYEKQIFKLKQALEEY